MKLGPITINICGCSCRDERRPATALKFWIRNHPGQTVQLVGETMLLLTSTQKCSLSIQPVDAHGNPALVDGTPTWSVADPNILTITPAADGLSAEIVAAGPIGATQVSVQADADLGGGVKTIAGTLDVQVAAGEAVGLSISAGTPVEQ